MIEPGINQTALLTVDQDGCYDVELSRIRLRHLPIAAPVIHALHLSKQELVCRFLEEGRQTHPAFKLVKVTTSYGDGVQIVRGKIRSNGTGHNLRQYIRERGPKELSFQLYAEVGSHEDYPGALDIKKILSWALMISP